MNLRGFWCEDANGSRGGEGSRHVGQSRRLWGQEKDPGREGSRRVRMATFAEKIVRVQSAVRARTSSRKGDDQ